jgi:hypothetical protein
MYLTMYNKKKVHTCVHVRLSHFHGSKVVKKCCASQGVALSAHLRTWMKIVETPKTARPSLYYYKAFLFYSSTSFVLLLNFIFPTVELLFFYCWTSFFLLLDFFFSTVGLLFFYCWTSLVLHV